MGRPPGYWRDYRKTPNGHRQMVLSDAKRRAKKQGVPYDLTTEDFVFPPSCCPVCNVGLVLGSEEPWTSPSLDRIVPEAGYVTGNVEWLCSRCNRLKSNASASDMYQLADWLYERYRERGIPCVTPLRPKGAAK